ncbi:MAG: saccharopine dehydrogenase family protein, partial [bacterium]
TGIPLILGAGIHPGMIELLGVSAARALDTVSAVEMFMIATLQDYGAPERFLPLFEQGWNGIDGIQTLCKLPAMTAVQVRKGAREKILPENALRSFLTLEGEEVDGFAMATCEPLALHRALGGDIDARMTMSYWPPAANAIVREASRGFAEGDTRFAPTLQAMWSTIDAETRRPPSVHFWAIARGKKAGHSASTTAFSRQDWANQRGGAATTAGVAVFAAEAISRGEISQSGVLSPVDLFAPEEVFEALARPQSPDLHVVTSEGP